MIAFPRIWYLMLYWLNVYCCLGAFHPEPRWGLCFLNLLCAWWCWYSLTELDSPTPTKSP